MSQQMGTERTDTCVQHEPHNLSPTVVVERSPYFSVYRIGRWVGVYQPRYLMIWMMMTVGLLCLMMFALTVGKLPISLSQAFTTLTHHQEWGQGSIVERVLIHIRLPRLCTAVLAGGALAVSGGVFQSISRNPLGSPDVIGFTTGAATGALLQIILFHGHAVSISLSAIVGGCLTALFVYGLSTKGGVVGRYRLILTGIGIGSVLSAFNGLLLVKGDLDDAVTANLWLSGSLHARHWYHVWPLVVGMFILLPFMKCLARPLSLLEMGDEPAKQLGVRIERVRLWMVCAAVMLAALATGATGPIAFIALAAPQLVNRFRRSHQLSIFTSAAMGGSLLLGADVITQLIPWSISIPIGLMTGLVGGIYLLWLLMRMR